MGTSRRNSRKKPRRATHRQTQATRSAELASRTSGASESTSRARLLVFSNAPTTAFVSKFVLVAALLLVLYAYPYAPGGFVQTSFEHYLSGYAHLAGVVLRGMDPSVSVSGNLISGRFPLKIVRDCDAMEVNILFASAIAAFPAGLRQRFAGLGVGLLLLVVANLSRIVSLYFIGVVFPSSFEVAHREVWPLVLIATALALFLAWARWERFSRHDHESPLPA